MEATSDVVIKAERVIHPKIKEFIAKSLVYFFTIKELKEFSKKNIKKESIF